MFLKPTRIIMRGYPKLEGKTLLEKRSYARDKIDDIRQRYVLNQRSVLLFKWTSQTEVKKCRLMREPRGHKEMYGAIIVPETERTLSGEADVGVLFCHNGENDAKSVLAHRCPS